MDVAKPGDITSYLSEESTAERELSRMFRRSAPLTILDIGACEAEDTVRYARRFPNSFIYAFEPLPSNQAAAAENLGRYKIQNAELVPVALSNENGTAVFHVSSGRPEAEFSGKDWNYGNKSSSLLPPASGGPMYGWIEFKETIPVKTQTLEAFAAARAIVGAIDFIHMDVQGAELLVLQGAGSVLARVSAIWLEVSEQENYRGQALRADIEAFLQERGFSLILCSMVGTEGDQLYVRRANLRLVPYRVTHALQQTLKRLRFSLGAIKSSLLKPLRKS